jgi:hypothetical protein
VDVLDSLPGSHSLQSRTRLRVKGELGVRVRVRKVRIRGLDILDSLPRIHLFSLQAEQGRNRSRAKQGRNRTNRLETEQKQHKRNNLGSPRSRKSRKEESREETE